MNLDKAIHALNRAFARAVRDALDRAEEGPRKDTARRHLRAAESAENSKNEADWLREIERADRALG